MIASYSHNFIFLKSRKTAGTSVEMVLIPWCSGRDIIAPSEATKLMGGPRNHRRWFGEPFKAHHEASNIRRALPRLWSNAFKFTVERHPYERVVSYAYWLVGKRQADPETGLQTFIEWVLDRPWAIDNRPIYCIDDKVAVDEIIRYELLWQRMAELAKRFGHEMPDPVPRAKGNSRLDRRPAGEILSAEQKGRIQRIVPRDFEELGFEP